MAVIIIRQFKGIAPVLNPRLLPEGGAVTAINTRLIDQTLGTWRAPTNVATITKGGIKKTIYRFGELLDSESQYWFSWTTDVDVVRAPIDGDTSERTYFTGDGYPKVTNSTLGLQSGTDYPVASYRLGVPVPDVISMTVNVTGTATDPESTAFATAYVLTYVTSFGEESLPSDPLGPVTFRVGQTIELRVMPTAPTGNYNITAKRIYRSSTGTTGTDYQFVAEVATALTSYDDTKTPEQLGETVSTWGWEQPPDGMTGLVLMANGIGVGFVGNTLYVSEPYALYAYPPAYRKSTESQIVGLGAFGQSVFVGTRANPFVLTGVDSASLTLTKLDQNQACVSKRSVVSMGGGVIYATPDGLYLVGNGMMQSLTENLIARDQWQNYKPESFHSYELDGRYIAFFDTGGRTGALVFDFKNGNLYELDQYCTAAWNDPLRDKLFMSQTPTAINSFDTSTTKLIYIWRSRIYRSPWDIDIGYAKIEAESYPLTFRLIGDGQLIGAYTVFNRDPFRVAHSRVRELQLEVEANVNVNAIAVAETGDEITKA